MIENQNVMNELITQFNREHFDKAKDLPLETLIAIRMVIDSIGRITDYAANIAETAINASIEIQ
jgi:phosphate uptake regulator